MNADEITRETPVVVNKLSGKYHLAGAWCLSGSRTAIPIQSAYDAPGLEACKRCIPGDVVKHGPGEKPTVLEVKSTVELTWHLPLDAGGSPHESIADRLMATEDVRWVDSVVLDQTYKMEKY